MLLLLKGLAATLCYVFFLLYIKKKAKNKAFNPENERHKHGKRQNIYKNIVY